MALMFCDVEASGLHADSWPVEVGWVGERGTGEAVLIRPAAGWTHWDPAAEAVHGISRDLLARDGLPVERAAGRVAAALAGHTLVSDNPGFDAAWTEELMAAGGLPSGLLVWKDLRQALLDACRPLSDLLLARNCPRKPILDLLEDIIGGATAAEDARQPRAHRAFPDAARMWRIYREVTSRAGAQAAALRAGGKPDDA